MTVRKTKPCMCGCGLRVYEDVTFRSGHDAKFLHKLGALAGGYANLRELVETASGGRI